LTCWHTPVKWPDFKSEHVRDPETIYKVLTGFSVAFVQPWYL
jgi:hypothetical protein